MARFPVSEPDTIALAQSIVNGLRGHSAVFPAPPVTDERLSETLQDVMTKQNAVKDAAAALKQAMMAKDAALLGLTDDMKQVLRYAENTVKFDDAKLKMLGWGGKAARTTLEPPGQPRALEAPRRGAGWISLIWKEPNEGGKTTAYKIQRRERVVGNWGDVAMSLTTELTLGEQARGTDWEYRVLAVNKAGESDASNIVEATL